MNFRNLLVLLLLLLSQITFAQKWGVNTESEFTNEATDIAVDASGNSYVTGYITGQTAFTANTVMNNVIGSGDVYVVKYNSLGGLIWTKHFSGTMSDRPFGIEIDNNGDIVIAGYFTGELNFDGNTLNSVNNSRDIFFAKLDENGTVLWAKGDGGSGSENLYGLTIDSQNNIILTGQFKGETEIGGQAFQSVYDPVNNTSSYDLFLAKYTPQGDPIWVERSEAIYEERGLSVDIDSDDNIFISGQFSDTMIFAGQQFNNNGYNVGFVSKLNSDGQIQWFNTLKAGMATPYSLTINNSDEIIVTGDFRGTLYHTSSFGTSSLTNLYQKKIFAIKISNAGEELWANAMGSDNELSARSVAVDDSKNIFIVGHFKCALTELHISSTALYNSVGGRDIFLWNMSDNGSNMITKQMGGKLNDYAYAVKMKSINEPLICGSYTMNLHVPLNTNSNVITNNQSDFNFHLGYSNFLTAYLHGDVSVNSFLTNGLRNTTPDYNYFYNSPSDSLNGAIIPITDTLHICANTQISYETYTYQFVGPGYYYNWSTGDTTYNSWVENSGTYTVEVERWDQCSSDIDTLEVLFHPSPTFPLISDSLGIQTLAPVPYADYTFCYPDSIYIWFNDLDTSNTFSVNGPGLSVSDTLPHLYSNEGDYTVSISNQYCTVSEIFELKFDHILDFDIDPYMVMEAGDSLTICEGDVVVIQILDAITNPDTIYGQYPTTPVISYSWEVNGPSPVAGGSNEFWRSFSPPVSGWYDVEYSVIVGYDNTCGIDSVTYNLSGSYYFEVLEQPDETVTISGDLLCPNGSVYLHIPNTIDGLSWSGPGIEWISSGGDSIQATAAGTYYYQGTQTDTVTGCTLLSSFSYTLVEKIPPTIFTNPGDGIVCPYDSVDMWVNDNYISYEWSGPSGMGLSFTDQHTDEELGFYYCTVLDAEGCYLTSPPVELKEFSSPYISIEPTNIICDSESVTLTATFITSSGMVNWSPPLSGNDITQQVNQPGWYVAEITSCNITVVDSVEIIDGSFSLTIEATDSSLCFGDTIEIQGPAGMSYYEWSNGESGVPAINVNSAGDYSLTAMNSFGCEAQSNEIPITFHEASVPPASDLIVLCNPEILLLENNTGFSTNWYSSDTLLQDTGNSIQVSVQNDTLIYLAHDQNDCPLSYGTIEISIIPEISDSFLIQGPENICANNWGTYYVSNLNGENIQWLISGNEISNDSIIITQGADLQGEVLQAVISNSCHSDTIELSVTVFAPDSITLSIDSVNVCSNIPVELYVNGETESVFWSGVGGNDSIDTLNFNANQAGYVFIEAIDTNGCFTNVDSVFINILNVELSLESNISGICYDDTVVLWVDAAVDTLIWTTPDQTYYDTEITIALNDINDGWYYLYSVDSMGCVFNDSIEIDSNPNTSIPLLWDTIVCEGTIIPAIIYVDSIYSGPSSVDIISDQQVTTTGWYSFTVENYFGCIYEDSVFIETYDCSMEFPNVITANNDGSNDFYIIPSAIVEPNNLFIVLNRWGQTVFEESGYQNTFSGTDLTEATYFYMYYPDYKNDPDTYYNGFFHLVKD